MNLNFSLNDVELKIKNTGFPPIPEGVYLAEIVKNELEKTKYAIDNGVDDCKLRITFKIKEAEFANRLLFDNLILDNSAQVSQEIGEEKIKKEKAQRMGRQKLKKLAILFNIDPIDTVIDHLKRNKEFSIFNEKQIFISVKTFNGYGGAIRNSIDDYSSSREDHEPVQASSESLLQKGAKSEVEVFFNDDIPF